MIGVVGLVVFANGVMGVLGVPSVSSVFGIVGLSRVFCWAGVVIVVVAWVLGVGLSSLKQVLLRELVRGVVKDFVLFGFFVCFIGVLIALLLSYFDISAIRSRANTFADFSKVV